MAQPGLGDVAFLGMGVESAWGTAVARTKFARLISETLKRNRPRTYPHGTGGASRRMTVPQPTFVDGGVEVYMNYEGFGTLLRAALGSVGSAQQGGTSAYLHTFSLADDLPSLSLEVDRDKTSFTYEGCKVNTMELRQAVGEILTGSFGVIGEDVNTAAATSETFPSSLPILDTHFSMEVDDVSASITEWSLSLNNSLSGGDRADLGTTLLKEPVRTGPRIITGSFTAEFDSTTLYDLFEAAASVKLEFLYSGGTIEGVYNYELNITIPIAYLGPTGEPQVGGIGPVVATFPFECIYDEGSPGDEIQVTLQNAVTSL